ncbi:MAG TPA: dihydrodipicolinate synthase family protein [Bryobacteraceae bacterium]
MSTAVDPKLPSPLRGIVPPLVTPLTETGKFDARAYAALIDRVIVAGVHGLFLLGTTGEFCSLSAETRRQVVTEGCQAARGRVPVVVNASDTSFDESLELTRHAARAGAGAVAICPPYYFSVTQEDLFRYAQKFAQAADLPVFLYNIPQNAHVEFEAGTVLRLADLPKIAGVKNSNGNIEYISKLSQVKVGRPGFSLLVGTEEIMMAAIQAGADGSVCGGANMFPALYVKLFEAIDRGRLSQARDMQELVARVAQEIYSVGPAKTSYFRGLKGALAQLGVCGESLAEPLTVFNAEEKQELRLRLNRLLPQLL